MNTFQNNLVFFLAHYLSVFQFSITLSAKKVGSMDYEMEDFSRHIAQQSRSTKCRDCLRCRKRQTYFNCLQSDDNIFLLDFPTGDFQGIKCYYSTLDCFLQRYKGSEFHFYETGAGYSRLTLAVDKDSELYRFCSKNYEAMFHVPAENDPNMLLCINMHKLSSSEEKHISAQENEYDYFWLHGAAI